MFFRRKAIKRSEIHDLAAHLYKSVQGIQMAQAMAAAIECYSYTKKLGK